LGNEGLVLFAPHSIDRPTKVLRNMEQSRTTFDNGEGPASILRGFTLREGSGTPINPPGHAASTAGGGIYCDQATAQILDRVILGNHVVGDKYQARGGGVYIHEGAPLLRRCIIENNYAPMNGAGLYFEGSDSEETPELYDCSIRHNATIRPNWIGDAIGCDGNGIRLEECTVAANADRGIAVTLGRNTTLVNTNIHGNLQGDIELVSSPATLIECVVRHNSHYEQINGGFSNWGPVRMEHCTIAANRSAAIPAIRATGGHRIDSCIIRSYGAEAILNPYGSYIEVQFSNIEGGWSGPGNIDADPRF
jgi:hypothetical protein